MNINFHVYDLFGQIANWLLWIIEVVFDLFFLMLLSAKML